MHFEAPFVQQSITTVNQHSTSPVNQTDELMSFRARYASLLNTKSTDSFRDSSISFLAEQLQQTSTLNKPFPTNEIGLLQWLTDNTEQVGKRYQDYLTGRLNGQPRKYFSNKSHALFFIKTVAPTKLVDGTWLYGFTQYHKSERFSALINTYLEELGDGVQEKNHVSLYKKLLRTYGLNPSDELDDKYYQQGAIQLALGQLTEYFLPEAIGFNLGYEQLPLHLLITAYELRELGIDSYYFTLHVTIDNAYSGHAKAAVHSVLDNIPLLGDKENYFSRVAKGFQLNNLGVGTEAIIADFDIEQELISIIKNKANIGKYMHGNHCLIEGRYINDWLSDPGKIPQFLKALESNGWIRRNENPKESRFWKLVDNNKAMMFGVFNAYEKQVVYDWIAGNFIEKATQHSTSELPQLNNVKKFRQIDLIEIGVQSTQGYAANIIPLHKSQSILIDEPKSSMDWDQDEALFQKKISSCANTNQLMHLLTTWMTPAKHHSVIGLKATQLYKDQLSKRETQF